jgi:hypothetical protein
MYKLLLLNPVQIYTDGKQATVLPLECLVEACQPTAVAWLSQVSSEQQCCPSPSL